MRNKYVLVTTLLIILCAIYLFFNKPLINASETIFIQALPNSLVLKSITESLSNQINAIIKEELNLNQNNDFNFFLAKKTQKLTLYCINDLRDDGNDLLISSLDHIDMSNFVAHTIFIKPEVEFFGGPFDEKDELTIMINDPNKELSFFNQSIKNAMHQANNEYEQIHHNTLYDITKSECYPYIPHIGLGRIRTASIKNQMEDPSQFSIIFERIQTRVKNVALELIKSQLNTNNENLIFNKIGIFDLNKQSWLKEYPVNMQQINHNALYTK